MIVVAVFLVCTLSKVVIISNVAHHQYKDYKYRTTSSIRGSRQAGRQITFILTCLHFLVRECMPICKDLEERTPTYADEEAGGPCRGVGCVAQGA